MVTNTAVRVPATSRSPLAWAAVSCRYVQAAQRDVATARSDAEAARSELRVARAAEEAAATGRRQAEASANAARASCEAAQQELAAARRDAEAGRAGMAAVRASVQQEFDNQLSQQQVRCRAFGAPLRCCGMRLTRASAPCARWLLWWAAGRLGTGGTRARGGAPSE